MSKKKPGKAGIPEDREITALKNEASKLGSELSAVRKKIMQNEAALKKRMSKKIELEDKLSDLLRSSYSSEKGALTRITRSASRKEAKLRAKLESLEKLDKIYEEKKARIIESKKRQAVLNKQLELLEKQAEIWGSYA
ncbi:MAG: hypothetical protein JW744_04445 [Candidatus Diapherotrites archaeon]|uniref:Uncharacterized protein n=1 Tax=Candidatus Iainarchaeum sp. TaxID=3101447 RepID=A0A938YXV9_9ARCH|nr:hypothetical protein [Candidatus Diapherotrites archaeon]